MQDATFNATYLNTAGEPLEYLDVIELVRAGRFDDVRIATGGTTDKPDFHGLDGMTKRARWWYDTYL